MSFAGDGGRLTLNVVRYEFREDASGTEANWLTGGVKVELSATGAFRCSCPVLFMADELSFFRDDLGRILARQKGTAALETEEDRVSITVELDRGAGPAGRLREGGRLREAGVQRHPHGRGVTAEVAWGAGGAGAGVSCAR